MKNRTVRCDSKIKKRVPNNKYYDTMKNKDYDGFEYSTIKPKDYIRNYSFYNIRYKKDGPKYRPKHVEKRNSKEANYDRDMKNKERI